MIQDWHKLNFETLLRAGDAGDLALTQPSTFEGEGYGI